MEQAVQEMQERLGYVFQDPSYLRTALTHSSYANETGNDEENNERLEFLGDAVLELCVSEELFNRFPDCREGQLTRLRARLVNKSALAQLGREIGIDHYLRLGKGEESQGGRDRMSLVGDAMEAVLGAVFLDGGYPAAQDWVARFFRDRWPRSVSVARNKDFKSLLQELTQRLYKNRPVYTLVKSSGPEHQKVFEVLLTLPTGETVKAEGPSLKKAEQKAACDAVHLLEDRDEAGEE